MDTKGQFTRGESFQHESRKLLGNRRELTSLLAGPRASFFVGDAHAQLRWREHDLGNDIQEVEKIPQGLRHDQARMTLF